VGLGQNEYQKDLLAPPADRSLPSCTAEGNQAKPGKNP